MKKDDSVYLRHILDAISNVEIDAVWDTVKRDIPVLKDKLRDLIE
jgi:uncharacterized protein with HEPN domain